MTTPARRTSSAIWGGVAGALLVAGLLAVKLPEASSAPAQDPDASTSVRVHGTFAGAQRIDLDAVKRTCDAIQERAAALFSMKQSRPSLPESFDSGLVRDPHSPVRTVKLPFPLEPSAKDRVLYVGELKDLQPSKPFHAGAVFLLARHDGVGDLARAQTQLGRVGLVSVELVRLLQLRTFPVRISFPDLKHARIEPLR